MEDFKTWFDKNKYDATNSFHIASGSTLDMARGSVLKFSNNPGVENSWWVSSIGDCAFLLREGSFEDAEKLWEKYEWIKTA